MQGTSAATAVYDTTELLEMILLHLPARHLLLSQSLSRKCRDLVQASPKIQRRLFYKPADNVSLHLIEGWYDIATRISNNERCSWTRAVNLAKMFRMNKRSYFARHPTSSTARLHGFMTAVKLDELASDIEGSWRRMYITSPLVREVKVECETREWFSWTRVLGVKAGDGVGVTMGDVIDVLVSQAEVSDRRVVGLRIMGLSQARKWDGRFLGEV
ncbi:hypothetical protein LTR78_007910 [Recurvomyces mirabilis]|uniref:F-box domain-containing protein n=1 Tax=Recurvomyces mirabilis TaxID=574656 RepID=A0AAE0TRG6_9PEZI|nr:hypothetical protein LTR78_007910 [Recurvomyces mirabilis]KAK5152445.1 hypothetical protein LTS14_008392 [Recurvomyces mirabilis]